MGVTHIIRGDDHLTNGGRQKILYEALGWPVPVMAHIPLIHGSDGAKLSKRHGALGVDAYRAMGYLPEAMRNYLVRLGWSHGDDEIMSMEKQVAWFDLDGVNRAPARFDFAKLGSINAHYLRAMSNDDLAAEFFSTLPHLAGATAFQGLLTEEKRAKIRLAMPLLKERAKTLGDLVGSASFIVSERPLILDPAAAALVDDIGRGILRRVLPALTALTEWSAGTTEAAVKAAAEAEGLKLGDVAQPLRAALTGRSASPGLFEVIGLLGRQESIARITDQADR
jgi:glutamyl-tRNA synthetase